MSKSERIPFALIAAVVVIVAGAAGLLRSSIKPTAEVSVPASAVRVGDIAVYDAWVREPANNTVAAAYLRITNTGTQPDILQYLSTSGSQTASVHDVGMSMAQPSTAQEAQGMDMMTQDGPLTIAPGKTLVLSPNAGHIMMEQLIGTLSPGSTVRILLNFARAGDVEITAPVIAIGAAPPSN